VKKTLGLHGHPGSGLSIATAVDRLTRCIVGWAVVEERTFDTLQPVIDQVPRSCRQFYSDGLNTYPTLLYYEGTHQALPDKSQTYSVEGSNAEIRHYLGRLHRRSRCFCRSVETLRRAFWLFAYCYNRRCLLWHERPNLKQANIGLAQFLPAIV
jgi:IS1 family transposase